jgi:hypothetical protein
MKTHTFSAQNDKFELYGALVVSDTNSKIFFYKNSLGFDDAEIKERNIADVPNFIASYIARCDNNMFDSVTVDGKPTKIICKGVSPSKETMNVFYIGSALSHIIVPDQSITLNTINGKKVPTQLSSLCIEPTTVPVDFSYTNNELLNEILKLNKISYDYDRKLNNKLLKIIKIAKQDMVKNPTAKYLFISKTLNSIWFDSESVNLSFYYHIPIDLIKKY